MVLNTPESGLTTDFKPVNKESIQTHGSPSSDYSKTQDSPSKLKKGVLFDMSHFKAKATNVLRDYYTFTSESFASIAKNYNDSGPEILWLLGTLYIQINQNFDKNSLVLNMPNANILEHINTNLAQSSKKNTWNISDTIEPPIEKSESADFTNFQELEPSINSEQKSKWGLGFESLFSKKKSTYPVKFIDRFQNLIWCTYRYNCRPVDPNNFSTDAGWGCMLRAGQSLVAQALQYHYFGQDYNIDWNNKAERAQYLKIIELLMDDQDDSSIFSIYKMSDCGKKQGKTVGEWFGPSGTCNILRELGSNCNIPINFYTTSDGIINIIDLIKVKDAKQTVDINNEKFAQNCFMYSTLVLLVTRLGIDKINPIYNDFIKFCLTVPQSVGIVGGKPSSALYFVGFDKNDLIYLDPHYNRPAIERKEIEKYSKDDIISYRCTEPRKINLNRIDPCMFIGFYIHDVHELVDFYSRVTSLSKKNIPSAVSFVTGAEPSFSESIESMSKKDMENSNKNKGESISQYKNKEVTESSEEEALDEWVL
ncbi:hypothetical protein BB561_005188 [Smittium simulii]|uniref:Cysteine protease n=1 Tax=Smittium simulii TaxID=133385 RepID=A0A2T9YBQ0_9FUNG|nr:hypothetical protein BB561_005188 [Smittium simulii]